MATKNFLLYLLILSPIVLVAQTHKTGPEQDCTGALPICTTMFTQTGSYTGPGSIENEFNDTVSCLKNGKNNAVWYIFTTTCPGILQFELCPLVNTDDYDFALFNITGYSCADILTMTAQLEVRCNYTLNDSLVGPCTGIGSSYGGYGATSPASGPAFNWGDTVGATPQTFVLLVNNFTSGGSGYTLDFSHSTTCIVDTVRPTIAALDTSFCNTPTDSIVIQFSRPILCSYILNDASQFTLTGPAPSPANIVIESAYDISCSSQGEFTTTIILRLHTPLAVAGNYELSMHAGDNDNRIEDICNNAANDTNIIYYQKPVSGMDFGYYNGGNPCTSDTIDFGIFTTPGLNDSACLWMFGDGTSSTDTSPVHLYPDTGTYHVHLTVYNGVCIDTASTTVRIGYEPGHEIENDICLHDSTSMIVVHGKGFVYAWQPSAGIVDTTAAGQYVSPPQSTWYFVNITDTVANNYCGTITDSFYVKVTNCDLGIQAPHAGQHLAIYPNPAQNIATIEWSPVEGTLQLTVTDLLGREVKRISTDGSNGTMLLDISALTDGLYLIKLYGANGNIMSGRLAVAR